MGCSFDAAGSSTQPAGLCVFLWSCNVSIQRDDCH